MYSRVAVSFSSNYFIYTMKTTTEIRLFELFRTKFPEDESKEMVGSINTIYKYGARPQTTRRLRG